MSFKMLKRNHYLLFVGIVLIAYGAFLLILRVKGQPPTTPSYITHTDLQELERRASNGDPVAQYGLSLYTDDPKRSAELILKAATSGYPPAVVTYANELMSHGNGDGLKAKKMLEDVAKRGYYPAIVEITQCLEQGKCGPSSNKEAFVWTVVARLLIEHKRIDCNKMSDIDRKKYLIDITNMQNIEQHLRKVLERGEVARVEVNARAIFDNISKATY